MWVTAACWIQKVSSVALSTRYLNESFFTDLNVEMNKRFCVHLRCKKVNLVQKASNANGADFVSLGINEFCDVLFFHILATVDILKMTWSQEILKKNLNGFLMTKEERVFHFLSVFLFFADYICLWRISKSKRMKKKTVWKKNRKLKKINVLYKINRNDISQSCFIHVHKMWMRQKWHEIINGNKWQLETLQISIKNPFFELFSKTE